MTIIIDQTTSIIAHYVAMWFSLYLVLAAAFVVVFYSVKTILQHCACVEIELNDVKTITVDQTE